METSAWFRELALRDPHHRTVQLSAPWGARIPSSGGQPGVYLVASGSATLRVDASAPIVLERGDVAVLPQGQGHAIASRPDLPVRSVEEFYATASEACDEHVAGGGGGVMTELRTLCFGTAGNAARAITAFAPPLVVLRAHHARPWFSHVVRAVLALAEDAERAPELATCRLGELLLLEALAGNVVGASEQVDPPVLRAAMLLRADLSVKWTVSALARKVGLSRSAFFDRFVRALGCPPISYLFRVRMEEAAILLADGASVDEVAARVGYRWSSSFTAAFQRFHGVAPSTYKLPRRAR